MTRVVPRTLRRRMRNPCFCEDLWTRNLNLGSTCRFEHAPAPCRLSAASLSKAFEDGGIVWQAGGQGLGRDGGGLQLLDFGCARVL